MKRQSPSTQKKRNRSNDNRVAGEMTLKELMYFKHTPAYVPSNEFKDQMEMEDLFSADQPMTAKELQISQAQSKLRDSVLNVNMDDILREIDVLLQSPVSSQTQSRKSLKWVEALDELYQEFLHRSKYVPVTDYPGSPLSLSLSSLSNTSSPLSVDSQLRKKRRLPNKVTRSNRSTKYNAWMEPNPKPNPKPLIYKENPLNHSLKNPVQTQILSPRKTGKTGKKPERPLTASVIERLTEPRFSQSSSFGFSDKGPMRKSELNTSKD